MKLYIKVILTFLLLTGSLYSKSTTMKPINVKLTKANYFLNINHNLYERVSLSFLIKPASFYSNLSLDFEKIRFIPKK
jgi:hypothetical protein